MPDCPPSLAIAFRTCALPSIEPMLLAIDPKAAP
jgi:hypothetical protein